MGHFGNDTTGGSATPSDKAKSGIGVGQAFIGWHPADWAEFTVGRMPMPLYITPMVWDSDINPEGAFEKFKFSVDNVDLFADFGQFDYQNPASAAAIPSSDAFILAWQAGANVKLPKDMSFKVAPVLYTYTGVGSTGNGLNLPFVGQGNAGVNDGVPGASAANLAAYNEEGLNDLLVLEVPAEFNFDLPNTPWALCMPVCLATSPIILKATAARMRLTTPIQAAFPGLTGPVHGENKAYQVGIGIGTAGPVFGPTQGLVYGSASKKNTWEVRCYWQHIEQYALDVNLIDSDFFEGRANLQGVYTAFTYCFTDAILGTLRYGYANRINGNLGTGGNNLDIPGINPIKNYNLVQLDLTWRF